MSKAYVYYWQELSTNKWYIGSRTRKGCHPNDGYITSSKIVRPLIQNKPTNWKRTIVAAGDPKDMLNFEITLLKALDAKNDPMSYNRHNGKGDFTTTGMKISEETRRKMSKAHIGKKKGPPSEETRRKISEAQKGIPRGTQSMEARRKMSEKAKLREERKRIQRSWKK